MSELERVGRLPVYVDEEQWSRAFDAAKTEVELLIAAGIITVPETFGDIARTGLAHRIASAAMRAAAQDHEGDIGEVPGVTVSRVDDIAKHTNKVQASPPVYPDTRNPFPREDPNSP